MFKTETWSVPDQNMIYVEPVLKVLRDGVSNRVKFMDINDEVVFTYDF